MIYLLTDFIDIVIGSWVANVVAHDQSSGEGAIIYSIFNGNENEAFAINPLTG